MTSRARDVNSFLREESVLYLYLKTTADIGPLFLPVY